MPDIELPPRKEVKAALRELGLSARQVDAVLRHGWRGLVSESEAEAAELREQLESLNSKFTRQ